MKTFLSLFLLVCTAVQASMSRFFAMVSDFARVIFLMCFLHSLGAHAMCASLLEEGGRKDQDLRTFAQWLLFDSQMAEHYRYLHKRILLKRGFWELSEEDLLELARLVPFPDVQHMLYQGFNKPIPMLLLKQARAFLDQAWESSRHSSSLEDIRKSIAVPKLKWNPNENWSGSTIDVSQHDQYVLGALWILATTGNGRKDLERAERMVGVYKTFGTKSDFHRLDSIGTKEQHAAVMAQRRLSKRMGEPALSIDASFLLKSFSSWLQPSSQKPGYYSKAFETNLQYFSPFSNRGLYPDNMVLSYEQIVRALPDSDFYLERLNALQVLQGFRDLDRYENLSNALSRTTLGWMQPEDYWDLFELAGERESPLGQAIVATHLALRHLHGEQLVLPKHFPKLVSPALSRIRNYVVRRALESDLLEEPILLAAFGSENDLDLLHRYLLQSSNSFQFVLLEEVWRNFRTEHMMGSIQGHVSRYQRLREGLQRSLEQILLGAMEARFDK